MFLNLYLFFNDFVSLHSAGCIKSKSKYLRINLSFFRVYRCINKKTTTPHIVWAEKRFLQNCEGLFFGLYIDKVEKNLRLIFIIYLRIKDKPIKSFNWRKK